MAPIRIFYGTVCIENLTRKMHNAKLTDTVNKLKKRIIEIEAGNAPRDRAA